MRKRLRQQFPYTMQEFESWFVKKYSISLSVFDNADFDDRCLEILRFLGYQLQLDRSTGQSSVINQVKKLMKSFEDLCMKYPSGMPDPLRIISTLPYTLRTKDNSMIFEHDHSMKSLRNTLIDRPKILRSIRDVLKQTEMFVKKEIIIDTFWEDIKVRNRINEAVPF